MCKENVKSAATTNPFPPVWTRCAQKKLGVSAAISSSRAALIICMLQRVLCLLILQDATKNHFPKYWASNYAIMLRATTERLLSVLFTTPMYLAVGFALTLTSNICSSRHAKQSRCIVNSCSMNSRTRYTAYSLKCLAKFGTNICEIIFTW